MTTPTGIPMTKVGGIGDSVERSADVSVAETTIDPVRGMTLNVAALGSSAITRARPLPSAHPGANVHPKPIHHRLFTR